MLLLAVLVVVAVVARRLNIAPSILLVIAGIALALMPGLPRIELAPELVLLGILPPLIYSAGVAMSWREFRFNLRPIALFAFGCVVFTTCAVAAAAHWLLGMPLAVGFVLGAIVAPPDAVAPLAIVRRLGVPRRLVVVLEGEGLANDATALILYRFAVAAVATGLFSFGTAAGEFAVIVVGEIAYGIAIGWLSLRLRRWARDPRVEITLSLLTPYAAFLLPAAIGRIGRAGDGGGRIVRELERAPAHSGGDAAARHLLLGPRGLSARRLCLPRHRHADADACSFSMHEVPWHHFAYAILLTVAVVIVTRFIWVYPAALLPRWLNPALARRDPLPPWRWLFFLGFVGVRGVVSLAAALAIPLYTAAGNAVPRSRPHSVRHLRRHRRHADRAGARCCRRLVRWLGLAKHAAERTPARA